VGLLSSLLFALFAPAAAAPNHVAVLADEQGYRLQVDGKDTYVYGMNWDNIPVGSNYRYDFWSKDDAFIEAQLRHHMGLLQGMGVNSIRQYAGIPPRWVTWIYQNYGISTMINPTFGRYGLTMDGLWIPVTDYSDPRTREFILQQTLEIVEEYKDVEGVLLFLLGNENNYGLSWSSFEIENLPQGEQQTARARHLYSLFGEAVDAIHAVDPNHPVAICNGDLQYAGLIAELVPNMDILGANVYRGRSSTDIYQRTADELGVPFLYTEFGADAYDARRHQEDQLSQAGYLRDQWQELYEQSWGKGKAGNAIGGYIFQWDDGWWKYKQEENLAVHDPTASWAADAYPHDFVAGANNMNEEWWGIAAKGDPGPDGSYEVLPRAAYYLLRDAFRLDVYAPEATPEHIAAHFAALDPQDYAGRYTADRAAQELERLQRVTLDDVRMDFSTWASSANKEGGGLVTPTLDHQESIYFDASVRPTEEFRGSASVNVLGNVASNRIDEIFYENRGRDRSIVDADGDDVSLADLDRVAIHGADFDWNSSKFQLKGFYRRGHYHWAYEGDVFGIYREANYGPSIDTYNANAPIGVEFTGKGKLSGVQAAFGPELYWGANPAATLKLQQAVGPFKVTAMHWEELGQNASAESTVAVPEPQSRKSSLALETKRGPLGLTLAGLFSGSNKMGQTYLETVDGTGETWQDSGSHLLEDQIVPIDTLGGRAKLTFQAGRFNGYAQGGARGLVADGGGDPTITATGWTLKESGRGNQVSALAGVAARFGNFEIAPNFLWQKPLVGPLPSIDGSYDADTGWFYRSIRPRNVLDDPFAVRDNRETTAFELLLSFDPTPATWMWQWDNNVQEDAAYAASLDLVYRMQPTSTDAGLGFTEDGVLFRFSDAPPAQDVWDARWRGVSALRGDLRLGHTIYVGTAQSNGDDPRLILHKGADLTVWWKTSALMGGVKLDDWGPYDYHRDYNLTYPVQLYGDASVGVLHPRIDRSGTRFGISTKYRALDEHSEDYVPGPGGYGVWGKEFELGAYVKVGR
jgi:beta-galactosidase